MNMAKASSAMTKSSNSAPLARVDEDVAALAAVGDLDLDETGLDEMDQADIKLPTKSLNMKGRDRDGEEIAKSKFYDTVDETQKSQARVVFLHSHKTNVFSRYDNSEGRNKIICRSDDLVTGTMRTDDGETQRPCHNCPDTRWRKEVDDKGIERNVRDCNLVHNVLSFDLEEEKLFMIRFKKGALKSFMGHVNKHHFNKGKAAGLKTQHIPLYIFEVAMKGELSDDGTHALPALERAGVLSKDQVAFMADGLRGMKEHLSNLARNADELGEASEGAEAAPSSNGKDYGGGEGQDFVEAPSESSDADAAPAPF